MKNSKTSNIITDVAVKKNIFDHQFDSGLDRVYHKVYDDEAGNFHYEMHRKDGLVRRIDPDEPNLLKFMEVYEVLEFAHVPPPPDTRTDEEKRLAEYQTELDPILAKIQFYEMEYDLEDDNARKQEIKKDILDVLKADWKAKKKAIRAKYPTGLWKPTAGGAE